MKNYIPDLGGENTSEASQIVASIVGPSIVFLLYFFQPPKSWAVPMMFWIFWYFGNQLVVGIQELSFYTCENCSKNFNSKDKLAQHKKGCLK